jgi:hypothetical protein
MLSDTMVEYISKGGSTFEGSSLVLKLQTRKPRSVENALPSGFATKLKELEEGFERIMT